MPFEGFSRETFGSFCYLGQRACGFLRIKILFALGFKALLIDSQDDGFDCFRILSLVGYFVVPSSAYHLKDSIWTK